jgi:hypothetical protein
MKIRIRGNSIRYRLDKKDIQSLQEQQKVEESTTIGAGTLHFCIKVKASGPAVKLEPSGLHLSVPAEQIKQWIETEQVGFSLELPNPDGSVLNILIEKDFKCLTERNEDESLAFENPSKSC